MELLKEFRLSKDQICKFETYMSLLLEWNEKFNLTAITDKNLVVEKHFYDSVMSCKVFDFKGKSLIDIGSGAGFPGVPLAIAQPELSVTLLEANGKRISFLKEVKEKLNLTNVTIIQGRAEELSTREKYDYVTARAVKELNVLLEISFHLLKVGGTFIAYKSTNVENEISNAQHCFKCLSIKSFQKFEYELPRSKEMRVLLGILKESKTISKYPRRYSEIVKSHL